MAPRKTPSPGPSPAPAAAPSTGLPPHRAPADCDHPRDVRQTCSGALYPAQGPDVKYTVFCMACGTIISQDPPAPAPAAPSWATKKALQAVAQYALQLESDLADEIAHINNMRVEQRLRDEKAQQEIRARDRQIQDNIQTIQELHDQLANMKKGFYELDRQKATHQANAVDRQHQLDELQAQLARCPHATPGGKVPCEESLLDQATRELRARAIGESRCEACANHMGDNIGCICFDETGEEACIPVPRIVRQPAVSERPSMAVAFLDSDIRTPEDLSMAVNHIMRQASDVPPPDPTPAQLMVQAGRDAREALLTALAKLQQLIRMARQAGMEERLVPMVHNAINGVQAALKAMAHDGLDSKGGSQ